MYATLRVALLRTRNLLAPSLAVLGLVSSTARADVDVYFNGGPAPVNWSASAGMWQDSAFNIYGVPSIAGYGMNVNAQINNGGTVNIDGPVDGVTGNVTWAFVSSNSNAWTAQTGQNQPPNVGLDNDSELNVTGTALNPGNLNANNEIAIGGWPGPGQGILNQGTDTLVQSNDQIYVGHGGRGTYNKFGGDTVAGNDFRVGNGSTFPGGADGTMNHFDGNVSMGRWLYIGRGDGARGVYNQHGGTVNVGDTVWLGDDQSAQYGIYNMTGGTLNVTGGGGGDDRGLRVGNRSRGEFHLTGPGIISAKTLYVKGDSGGTVQPGLFTMSDGQMSIQRIVRIADRADGGATGSFIQSGGAFEFGSGLTGNDQGFILGREAGSVGIYNISGGVLEDVSVNAWGGAGSWNYIGNGGSATMDVSGTGQVNFRGRTHIGAGAGGGTVIVRDTGSFNVTNHELIVGEADSNGTFNMQGGSSNVATDVNVGHWHHDNGTQGNLLMDNDAFLNVGNVLRVGGDSPGGRLSRGFMQQLGNSIVNVNNALVIAGNSNADGNGVANANLGTYILDGANAALIVQNDALIGQGGTGTMTHNQGIMIVTAGNLRVGSNPGSNGLYNQNGGLVEVSSGQLLVGPAGIGTMNVGPAATVNAGAVVIGNGTSGTLNLNGLVDGVFGGPTAVSVDPNGTLAGTGTVGSNNGSLVTLNGGSIAPGNSIGTLTVDNLTVLGGLLKFELGVPGTSDLINSLGDLNLAGPATVNLFNGGGMAPGNYTLIDYVNPLLGAFGNLSIGGALPNPALQYILIDNAANTSVDLVVAVAGNEWILDNDGLWSVAANWNPPAVPDGTGAIANFLGAISANRNVDVDSPRTVGTLVFDNAGASYRLFNSDLTLDVTAGSATLAGISGNHEINSNVAALDHVLADIQGGSVTLSGFVTAPNGLTKTGAGTLVTSSSLAAIGPVVVSQGVLESQGVTNSPFNGITVGNSAGDTGTLRVSAGLTVSDGAPLAVGTTLGATGVIEATGGTLQVNAGSQLQLGLNGGTGLVNHSAGLVDLGGTTMLVGVNGNSNGTYTQTGGIVQNVNDVVLGSADASNGLYDLRGGVLNVTNTVTATSGGVGSMYVNGGTLNYGAASINPDRFGVGWGAGSNGLHNHAGGKTIIAQGELSVGRENGIGQLDVVGDIQSNGNLSVGGWDGGTGVLNQNAGVVNANGEIGVGVRGAASIGTYNLNDGNVSSGSWLNVGRDGGTGIFNHNSAGVVSANPGGSRFIVGWGGGSYGEYNQTTGTTNVNEAWIGDSGGTGRVNVSGNAAFNTTSVLAVGQGGGNGGFTQSDNSVVNVAREFIVGQDGGSVGVYTMNGGNLNITTAGATDSFLIGNTDGVDGTFNLNGGAVTQVANVGGWSYIGRNGQNSNGTVNMTNGTLNLISRTHVGFVNQTAVIGPAQQGRGVFNQSGGVVTLLQGNAGEGLVIGDGDDGNGNIAEAGGEGYYNLSNDAVLNVTGDIAVAHWVSAYGELNVHDDARVTTTGLLRVGNLDGYGNNNKPARGFVTQDGPGSLVQSNRALHVGRDRASVGVYNLSAGTLIAGAAGGDENNWVAFGYRNAAQGTLNVSGTGTAIFNGDVTVLGRDGGARGTVNHTGGSVTINGATGMIIGDAGGGRGFYNLGGTGVLTVGNEVRVGGWNNAEAKFNITGDGFASIGGTMTVAHGDNGAGAFSSGDVVQNGANSLVFIGGDLRLGLAGVGANRSTGTYSLMDGTLIVSNNETIATDGHGTFTQTGGYHAVGGGAGVMTIAANANAIGSYTLAGGTLDMGGGTITYGTGAGTFTMNGGILKNAGLVNFPLANNGGIIQPGASPGITQVNGNYSQNGLATYDTEILDTSGNGTGHDLLDVLGAASLDGTLNVIDLGYAAGASYGDSFVVVQAAGGVAGTFSNVVLPPLPGGLNWSVLYHPNDVTLAIVPEPSTLVLAGLGLAGLALAIRRRRRS
jgi:hypothetical protein